jgi:hypothetical protein
MTQVYTKIPKPSAQTYTNTNPIGKQSYDESSLAYDDANTFYDGVNQGAYTNISKPSTQNYTNINKPT